MSERSDLIFERGLDLFTGVVNSLSPDDWSAPTACEGWSARDVLGHVSASVQLGTSLLRGETPAWAHPDRPGDVIEGEPAAFWAGLEQAARTALEGVDLDVEIDSPMGRRTVRDSLAFPAVDLFVHAWDIAGATGSDVEIPSDVIEFAHRYLDPIPDEIKRGGPVFGPEVEAPADATETERFVAWTGRQPR